MHHHCKSVGLFERSLSKHARLFIWNIQNPKRYEEQTLQSFRSNLHAFVWRDLFVRVRRDSFVCARRDSFTCDVTQSYVRRDSFTHTSVCSSVVSCIYDVTHLHVWYDAYSWVTWHSESCVTSACLCDVTQSYVRRDAVSTLTWYSQSCVTCRRHMRDVTHSDVSRDAVTQCVICVTHSHTTIHTHTNTYIHIYISIYYIYMYITFCSSNRFGVTCTSLWHGTVICKTWCIHMGDVT